MKAKINKINRIYHPWYLWECYKNGFYSTIPPNQYSVLDCKEVYLEYFTHRKYFYDDMKSVFRKWKYSCEHFLTNPNMNRIAWLGQASVCFRYGISSFFKSSYSLVSDDDRFYSDDMALDSLNNWIDLNGNKKR